MLLDDELLSQAPPTPWRKASVPLFELTSAERYLADRAALMTGLRVIVGAEAPTAISRQVIDAAAKAFVLPALWPRVETHRTDLCDQQAELLWAAHFLNGERNAAIVAQLERMGLILNQHNIIPVAFKGAAHLSCDLWPDRASRVVGDIDVIIPRTQLALAAKALTGGSVNGGTCRPGEHHLKPFSTADDTAMVELHREPLKTQAAQLLDADTVLRGAQTLRLGQAKVSLATPTHAAIAALAHGPLHHHAESFPARDLLDLYFLSQRTAVDWDLVCYKFQAEGHEAILALAAAMFTELTGTSGPFQRVSATARRKVARDREKLSNPVFRTQRILRLKLAYAARHARHSPQGRRYVLSTVTEPRFYRSLGLTIAAAFRERVRSPRSHVSNRTD